MKSIVGRASRAVSFANFYSEKQHYEITCKVETLVIEDVEQPYTLRVKWKRKSLEQITSWVSATEKFIFNEEITIPAKMNYHPDRDVFDPKPSELIVEQKDGPHLCLFGKADLDFSKYCRNTETNVTKELIKLTNCIFPNVFLNIELTCIKKSNDSQKNKLKKMSEHTDSEGGTSSNLPTSIFSQTEEAPNIENHLRMQINDLTLQLTEVESDLEISQNNEQQLEEENCELKKKLDEMESSKANFNNEDSFFSESLLLFAKFDTELNDCIIKDIEATHSVETVDGEVVPSGAMSASVKATLCRQIKELEALVIQCQGENEQLRTNVKRLEEDQVHHHAETPLMELI